MCWRRQVAGGQLQSPLAQVAHGRLAEQAGEALGERRAGQAGLSTQCLGGPGSRRVAVQQRQGTADLWIPQTGQPAGLFRGQRIQVVAYCLDEQQFRQPGQHRGRAGALPGGLLQGAPERQVQPSAGLDPQHQQRGQQTQQEMLRHLAADEAADHRGARALATVAQPGQAAGLRGLDQVLDGLRGQPRIAAQHVRWVARQQEERAGAGLPGRLSVQPDPQPAVEHIVVGHQAGRRRAGQLAVLGADLGADAPGFGELGLQEGARTYVHGLQQLGQSIHRRLACVAWRRLDQESRRVSYRRSPASFLT